MIVALTMQRLQAMMIYSNALAAPSYELLKCGWTDAGKWEYRSNCLSPLPQIPTSATVQGRARNGVLAALNLLLLTLKRMSYAVEKEDGLQWKSGSFASNLSRQPCLSCLTFGSPERLTALGAAESFATGTRADWAFLWRLRHAQTRYCTQE